MKECCENPLCENKSIKEVPVSVKTMADQARALCAPCEEAYSWGVQHGKMIIQPAMLWIVVAADSGLIAHARAYSSKAEAEGGLIKYLRTEQFYKGADDIDAANQWINEHHERLSVEIIHHNMISNINET